MRAMDARTRGGGMRAAPCTLLSDRAAAGGSRRQRQRAKFRARAMVCLGNHTLPQIWHPLLECCGLKSIAWVQDNMHWMWGRSYDLRFVSSSLQRQRAGMCGMSYMCRQLCTFT